MQFGILKRPKAVVASGTMDENQALFVRSKIITINPTGDFRRFNIKIFQHIDLPLMCSEYHKNKNLGNGRMRYDSRFMLTE
jgi:hypothetical protein